MEEENKFLKALEVCTDYFIQIYGDVRCNDGWKISLQGRTLEHVNELKESLIHLLHSTKASYKFGTKRLIDLGPEEEQSTKLLTIYIPNGVDPKSYAELVRLNLLDYKGWEGIADKKSYTKYAEGIFYRNDRNPEGEYIPA